MAEIDLKGVVLEFRDGILGDRPSWMMCAAVCWPLQGFLSMSGIETKVIEADWGMCNHVWLEMSDGRIIDPTIDQFSELFSGMPSGKVYIGEKFGPYLDI